MGETTGADETFLSFGVVCDLCPALFVDLVSQSIVCHYMSVGMGVSIACTCVVLCDPSYIFGLLLNLVFVYDARGFSQK